ncbi:V-type ATP synthase subunit C [bioreactor metagenome]|uniref:V-type ATP synthase subunit C n=1 Tax=bioreactor metagenome TaxID=1076179 RepID=A0A644STF9_9ZZZZ|nr:V-type ATP synthase subunit C [Methanobrevibacter sp.]MEA4956114.1 V-type ATP synthase subunit C [Methanobrevibacter sp.]
MADEITALLSQFGISPEAFIALAVIAVVVVGAIIVIITSRPVLDIYPYLHPIARVRARKGRLFDEKQISEIVESNTLDEVKNYLRGFPDYAEYVDNFELEKAFDIQLAETYDLLSRIAPKKVQKSFYALAKKSDITNIKSLLAAKQMGMDKKATLNLLIPTGKLYGEIEQLADANNINEVITGLDGTEYSAILEDAIPEYEELGMILPLESALDKYYLQNLLESSGTPSDENSQVLYSYVGDQVDVSNLKLIIRAKADGLSYDKTSPYMIQNGYKLREWKLKDLMESEDVAGVISSLEGTDFSNILADALSEYNETGSVSIFEKTLDEYLINNAKSLSLRKPLGIGPILGFLSQKEREIKNLKIIVRAKREINFPISELKEMLV